MLYPEYRPTPTALSAVNPPYYYNVPMLALRDERGRSAALVLPPVTGNQLAWGIGLLALGWVAHAWYLQQQAA